MRKHRSAYSINDLTRHLGRVHSACAVRVEVDGEFQIDRRTRASATSRVGWRIPGTVVGIVIIHAADSGRSTREDADGGRNRIRGLGGAGVCKVYSLGG